MVNKNMHLIMPADTTVMDTMDTMDTTDTLDTLDIMDIMGMARPTVRPTLPLRPTLGMLLKAMEVMDMGILMNTVNPNMATVIKMVSTFVRR